MKTVKDFASLLNHIKRDEFGTQKYKDTNQSKTVIKYNLGLSILFLEE